MANYNLKEKVTLNGRTFFVMRVKAENIELRNFGYHGSTDLKTLTEAGVIGMNGCFFGININNGRSTLNNIVYQGGQPLGSLIDDSDVAENKVGTAVIYWTGTVLHYNDSVHKIEDFTMPTARDSWIQGGIGLYFGKNNWETLMRNSMGESWSNLSQAAYRTAMVADIGQKDVYLMAWPEDEITFGELREDIFSYFGITESTSSAYEGITLDGGGSTQIRGYDELGINGIEAPSPGREVPQVIVNTYYR